MAREQLYVPVSVSWYRLTGKVSGEVSELAEGARLEIVLVGKTCHVGSNPTLSAMNVTFGFGGIPPGPV
jgi:hypothetical protein